MITNKQAMRLAHKFNINLSAIPLNQLRDGLNIELEHKDLTDGNLSKTMKIVIAHIEEDPQYYLYLKPLERVRARYWKHHRKPSIFNLK